jgi:hydroxymethylpyrimidine/phosphomethylpyrimidine kinase
MTDQLLSRHARVDKLPIVLVFAGNDPTGGTGLQADIDAVISMGCRPAPVITTVVAQDTVLYWARAQSGE